MEQAIVRIYAAEETKAYEHQLKLVTFQHLQGKKEDLY